jgi:hypothetical protein
MLISSIGVHTFAWVFINLDTRIAYAQLFEEVFSQLENTARQTIHFPYMQSSNRTDAEGIRVITTDMCRKQAPG